MGRGRFAAIASAFAIAALGLSLALGGVPGAAPTSAAAVSHAGSTAAAAHYVVLNCNKTQVMPETIVLACADRPRADASALAGWTPELASAYGTEWEHVCVPYCAASDRYAYYRWWPCCGAAPP